MSLITETGMSYFYQWDTNQILIVEDEPNCREVHFGYRDGSFARVCQIREEDGRRVVDIPNELLQKDRTFFVYPISEEEDDAPMRTQSFVVLLRPKPDDYVYTQTEVQNYEALEERITALEENGGTGSGTIKTVNGVGPDENGNVVITIPDAEVEIPNALPNPNALTFTGAVNATYDGSKAVSVEIPAAGGGGESYIAKLTTIASGTILKGTAAGITDTGLTIGDLRKYKYFVLYVKSQGQNLYWGLSWKAAWGCIGRWQHSSIAFTYEWKDSNKTVLEIFVGSGTGYESKVGIYDNSSDANPPLYKYPSLIIMGADSMPVYVQNGAELTVDAIWEIKGCLEYES